MLPGTVGRFARAVLGEVLLTGVPVVGAEVEERTPAGGDRSFLLSFCRLDGEDGVVLGAAAFVVDVSDRRRTRRALERANARLELLGRAAAVLSASLDLQRTLDHLGRLVVPDFADHCIVDLVDDDPDVALRLPPGTVRRYAIVHAPGLGGPGAWSPVGLPVTYPPSHPVHATLTTGRVSRVDVDPGDFDYRAVAPTETSARYAREVGVRAAISVPLRARGQIVGAASFALSASGRRYDDEDELLAVQLADRAAVAIDNARTHEREQRHGLTLQRRLLPARLPQAPGLRAAATYLPAGAPAGRGAGTQVGGDWYDLVPLPGGRISVVLGDVAGHGLAAAAITAQLRHALRAHLLRASGPGPALDGLNQVIAALLPGEMATAVVVELDPATGEVAVANAGHLPVLRATAAGAEFLTEVRGPALGLIDSAAYRETSIRLEVGDRLLLFSDGLVERGRAGMAAGLERLRAAAASGPIEPEALLDTVLTTMDPPAGDDVTLLGIART